VEKQNLTANQLKATMKRLKTVLNERWEPEVLDEWSFVFPWVAGCIPLSCYAEVNPDMQGFVFRAINPLPVEPDTRPLVAEFIHRVNCAQPIGNWAIDLDTGDVRFKNGVYFRRAELTESMIRNVIESSLFFVYHDIMGLVKLQTGGTLHEAMAARGIDHGVGHAPGMKEPGVPPTWTATDKA
jgi:hypothetical protein